ncbi:MAG TPA: hydantoinase/oxoprolinase family protein [Candidatus Dormibacteraeota bacterium]|nr:hydantoinase/oxoprolinase family protein [Candidatus Dormibacteraeota bacterium]
MSGAATRLVGVDVGGTFTDVVAIDEGRVTATKVPTDVRSSDRSILQGAREIGADQAGVFNVASTAGLNAVITRSLPKVAFLTTIGHRDLLDKGRGWRPLEYLTDASWRRGFSDSSRPLVPRYLRRGIRERLTSDGNVLVPLDEDQARHELEVLKRCGVEGVAVCLLHAWANPVHEIRLRELVREVLGDVECSISSEVSPLAKEYPRASTTLIDLLMKWKYRDYTSRLQAGLDELGFQGEFNYADCSAMLMPASYAMERPYRVIVGGPAAGTVASAHFGTFIGKANLLCCDVGGTSCDISLVMDGQPLASNLFELEWDLIVTTLSTEIVTLGAGGGSIVAIGKAGELLVGPGSAGADPGPACYGKGGGNPTLTDTALLIGILAPDRFLGGRMPLSKELALQAYEALDTPLPVPERIKQAWGVGLHNIAEGLLDITIRHGIDPRDFSLVAYGAAGPMTMPSLLDILPLQSVIVPPHPGEFSALGLVSSDRVFTETRTLYGVLDEAMAPRITELYRTMEQRLQPLAEDGARFVRTFDGRLLGQGFETPFIPVPDGDLDSDAVAAMIRGFHDEYEKRSGTRFERFQVEGVTYRLQLINPSPKAEYPELGRRAAGSPPVAETVTLRHLYDREVEARVYERDALLAGDTIESPAIVREENSTTFVPPGRRLVVGDHGELVIS